MLQAFSTLHKFYLQMYQNFFGNFFGTEYRSLIFFVKLCSFIRLTKLTLILLVTRMNPPCFHLQYLLEIYYQPPLVRNTVFVLIHSNTLWFPWTSLMAHSQVNRCCLVEALLNEKSLSQVGHELQIVGNMKF